MKRCIFLYLLLLSQVIVAQNNYLLAENYYREGEYEKATQIYKKLVDKNPYNTTYLKRLISCYQETNQFSSAETLLTNRLRISPHQTYLNVFLGYNFEKQEQPAKAKIYYEKALKSIEKKANYSGIIGRLFKDYHLLDYAIQSYEKGMKKNPNANYSFQIAQIYGEKGEFEKMFQSYIDMIDKNSNYLNTVQRFASKYITDDAENSNNILFKKTLLRASISNPKDVWNVLLSWLFTQQKDYNKALIQEKALFQRESEDVANILSLGKIAFENRYYDAATKCFSFALKNANYLEEKLEALLYQTKIAIAQEVPETEKLFQQIFSTYGKNTRTLPLQIAYADFLTFQENQPEKAKEVLENALKHTRSKFEKAQVKLKLGDVLVFTGQYNKALIYFSQIQTQLKNHQLAQQARFKVAQTSYFKGDFTWAKAQLKILKGSATQLIANDAVDLFLKIVDNEPVDSIPSGLIQYAKADLLSFQNKNKQAITVLNIIITDFKGQPVEDEALFKQATLFVKQKEYENAITNYIKIINMDAEGILVDDAHFKLAEVYNNQLNKPEKASEYYQKIIFDFPSSIFLVDARKKFRKLRGDGVQ